MSDSVFLPAMVQGVVSHVIAVYEYTVALGVEILTASLSKLVFLVIEPEARGSASFPFDSSGEANIVLYSV